MKAITLHQPWASLVALGAKTYETRSWATKYRGPLAIHAGKAMSRDARELCYDQPYFDVLHDAGYDPFNLPLGAVVAVCELVICLPTTYSLRESVSEYNRAFGNWGPGRYAWQLTNIRRFNPAISARGTQNLWNWDERDALRAIGNGKIELIYPQQGVYA